MFRLSELLIASLFIVSGVRGIINFDGYASAVSLKNIPFPTLVAALALTLKVIGGLSIVVKEPTLNPPKVRNNIILGLIIFTALATILYHNAFTDSSQFGDMLKNFAVMGGLLLLRS